MLSGIGIDILDVKRMERELGREGGGMCQSVFTPVEMEESRRSGRQARHLAACFAVKEALFKALGTGWQGGLAWQEVELRHAGAGRSALALSGRVRQAANRLGVTHAWASTTYTEQIALASVVLETEPATQPGSET